MTYRIVVGVDGSPHSEAALRWALDVAEARRGELTAVLSWQFPFVSIPAPSTAESWSRRTKEYLVEMVSAVAPISPGAAAHPRGRG